MKLLRNVARNALRPSYLPVVVRKLWTRLRDDESRQAPAARAWAAKQAESYETLARTTDAALWSEAAEWERGARVEATRKLSALNVTLGGGGAYPFLYFLVRHRRPAEVLETGVAAGFSSLSILEALARNGTGRLHSSDFPYVRLENPEQYIGCLVPPTLRVDWDLRLEGDRANLPAILKSVSSVDLFHYDSDKSAGGRAFALSAVEPRLSPTAIVLMDDIQDNWFFRRYVEDRGTAFRVFEFGGKYVGAIGL